MSNGDCRIFTDFGKLDGQTIGGVNVKVDGPVQVEMVTNGKTIKTCGKLYLTGTIWSFKIGGQELFIDEVEGCIRRPKLEACIPCPKFSPEGITVE